MFSTKFSWAVVKIAKVDKLILITFKIQHTNVNNVENEVNSCLKAKKICHLNVIKYIN